MLLAYWNDKTHQINPEDELTFVIRIKVLCPFSSNFGSILFTFGVVYYGKHFRFYVLGRVGTGQVKQL